MYNTSVNSQRRKHLRNQRLDSAALFHFRDNYEAIRDAGRTKEIHDCPGDSGTVGTYASHDYMGPQSVSFIGRFFLSVFYSERPLPQALLYTLLSTALCLDIHS